MRRSCDPAWPEMMKSLHPCSLVTPQQLAGKDGFLAESHIWPPYAVPCLGRTSSFLHAKRSAVASRRCNLSPEQLVFCQTQDIRGIQCQTYIANYNRQHWDLREPYKTACLALNETKSQSLFRHFEIKDSTVYRLHHTQVMYETLWIFKF